MASSSNKVVEGKGPIIAQSRARPSRRPTIDQHAPPYQSYASNGFIGAVLGRLGGLI
jgi:hypothetical protein